MNTRSVVVGVAGSAAILLLAAQTASANVAWCVSDPPIQVVTPGGHNLTVNNQVFLPPNSVHLKAFIYESAVAVSDEDGGTLIIVRVYVPESAHVVSSENRYQVSEAKDGSSEVTLYLHVPVS